jgi:hypothetical protein
MKLKSLNLAKYSFGAFLLASVGMLGGCGGPNTITTEQALILASKNYQCPPGLVVAFESKESNLSKIQKASTTNEKFFNDIDCSKPEGISIASQVVDIKSWLPFVGTEVNNGVVLIQGRPTAVKYKDPSGKYSFEPIRIGESVELDKYFKAQGFQTESKDASKNLMGQKWNLFDTKGADVVRNNYIKDGIISNTPKAVIKKTK